MRWLVLPARALTAHQEKERDECASGGGFFIAQMHLFSGERKESDWASAKEGTPVIILMRLYKFQKKILLLII